MAVADDYEDAARRLSPKGRIWETEDWRNFCAALGASFGAADTSVAVLLDEWHPDTTDELLSALERVYGLPEDCTDPPTTTEDRRAALAAKMRAVGRDGRAATVVGMALRAGYEITITTHTVPVCGVALCGDPLYDEEWAFHIDVPEASIPEWLQCMIRKVVPAHISLSFSGS